MRDYNPVKTGHHRPWPGHEMPRPPLPGSYYPMKPDYSHNSYYPHDNSHGVEDTNIEEHKTMINEIVTTIKNIITQAPNLEEAAEGEIIRAGDMGVIEEATTTAGIGLDEEGLVNAIFNNTLNENGNGLIEETFINQPPAVVETPTEAAHEVFTNAVETVTEMVKSIYDGFSDSSEEDHHEGGMMAHHSHKDDHETVYIILGIVLAVLALIGIVLGFIYWYYKRRGFHHIEGENKVTVHKAREPSIHTVEQAGYKEDSWLKSAKGTKH